MTAWNRTWWLLREHQSFWGTVFSLMVVMLVIFNFSMTFSRHVFLWKPSKRIRCPTHSPSPLFHIYHPSTIHHHIPPSHTTIHTPPHPSILLMVRKSCTTWNVQNLRNNRINYQPSTGEFLGFLNHQQYQYTITHQQFHPSIKLSWHVRPFGISGIVTMDVCPMAFWWIPNIPITGHGLMVIHPSPLDLTAWEWMCLGWSALCPGRVRFKRDKFW